MHNALSIDVEDWYHGCCAAGGKIVAAEQRRVRRNLELILSLLARFQVKATFFVLGSLAELDPSLVPLIAGAGHEVASHGYSHTLVPLLGPERFRDELRRTSQLIAEQAGVLPEGFRAPQWSLGSATPWAMDLLREEGFLYDSSYNPLPFIGNRRGPRAPFQIATPKGMMLELPPMVTPSPLGNLPTGGGWGFRFFPLSMIRCTMESSNRSGFPAVLYLHPRELDPFGPRLKLSPFQSFVSYGPRTSASVRLRELLGRFSFKPLKELAAAWKPAY